MQLHLDGHSTGGGGELPINQKVANHHRLN